MPSIISGSDDFNTNAVSNGNEQVFTSSGTFNVPLGVSRVKVTVIGAAGNGGTGLVGDAAGGGGGAGGYVVDYVAVTSGGTATVTVGTNGGTRTSSFVGGTTLTASGGSNGANASSGVNGNQGLSGAASVFGQTFYSAGSFRFNDGTYVGNGRVTVSTPINANLGGVWQHGYGVAGNGRSVDANNTNRHIPLGFGAGGGGGETVVGTQTGGTGTNGVVIVEW